MISHFSQAVFPLTPSINLRLGNGISSLRFDTGFNRDADEVSNRRLTHRQFDWMTQMMMWLWNIVLVESCPLFCWVKEQTQRRPGDPGKDKQHREGWSFISLEVKLRSSSTFPTNPVLSCLLQSSPSICCLRQIQRTPRIKPGTLAMWGSGITSCAIFHRLMKNKSFSNKSKISVLPGPVQLLSSNLIESVDKCR